MTLKSLSEDFFTDGKTIYYQNYGMKKPKPIPGVDAASFRVESQVFASDQSRVYATSGMREGLQIFTESDRPNTIFIPKEIDGFYFADNENLYRYNHYFITYRDTIHLSANEKKIKAWLQANYPNRDAWWCWDETFYNNLKQLTHKLFTNGKKIFYHIKDDGDIYDYPIYDISVSGFNKEDYDCFLALRNADVQSIQALNNVYAKDNQNVYFYSRIIPADASTFEVIAHLFAKDKDGIWYNGRRCIEIEDATSFEVLTVKSKSIEPDFARDKFNVYATHSATKVGQFEGYANLLKKLKNSDPNTFQIISDVWSKDKNNVYWYCKIYPKADAATFEKISDRPFTEFPYARDKDYVYIDNGQTLKKGLHGGSFQILNAFWAMDDFVVYSLKKHRIQKGIDVPTFKVLNEHGEAEDKNFHYRYDGYEIIKTPR